MKRFGKANRVLFVDLTQGAFREDVVPDSVIETFISGHGVNYWLYNQYIPLEAEPLSAENGIVLGTGIFCGTPIPGSSQLFVTTKYPLTGGFATGGGGGHFSIMMKTAGFDYVVITGASSKPVYLMLSQGNPQLLDASDLWGKDNFDTVDVLRERHDPCSIVPIGQAGEKLVKVTVTAMDKLGTVGAAGLPAVMGFKNLKAMVAVRGGLGVEPVEGRTLLRQVDEMVKKVLAYRLRDTLVEEGAIGATAGWRGSGAGFQGKDVIDKVRELHKTYRKTLACPTCPIADKESICFTDGAFAGMKTYITAFMGLREGCGGENADEMLGREVKIWDTYNRLGLDRHNVTDMVQLIHELAENGKIDARHTRGVDFSGSFQSRLDLLEMIAHRRGIGDLFADGADEALKRLGLDPEAYTATIKGYQCVMDPRRNSMGTMEFEMLVNPRGGVSAIGAVGSPSYNPKRPVEQYLRQSKRIGVSEDAQKRIFSESGFNVARLVRHAEDWFSLHNVLGLCHRLYISRFQSIDSVASFYNALTGENKTGSDLLLAAEKAWNLWRHLNAEIGIGSETDRPPKTWFRPLRIDDQEFDLKDYYGTKALTEDDIRQMLSDYYDERGWDPETGRPGESKLEALGVIFKRF